MSGLNFKLLVGKTLTAVENHDNERIIFTVDNGEQFMLYHNQDCCESVLVEDIVGELSDLVGSPLKMAEEVSNGETPEDSKATDYAESHTWTFYKLATVKGYVTIRWFGTSNGYYSESVDFEQTKTIEDVKADVINAELMSISRTMIAEFIHTKSSDLRISVAHQTMFMSDLALPEVSDKYQYLHKLDAPLAKGWRFAPSSMWEYHNGVGMFYREVVRGEGRLSHDVGLMIVLFKVVQ